MAVVMDNMRGHVHVRLHTCMQYTGVLTLLQGTTGFDHTPS